MYRDVTQGFVMYNATNFAPQLFASRRLSAPLCASPLCAPCRNSTQRFVCQSTATHRHASKRNAPLRSATICLSIYHRISSRRFALHCSATFRRSTQFNDLFVYLSPLRPAYRLTVALLNAKICLLLRDFTLLLSTQRRVALFNATN